MRHAVSLYEEYKQLMPNHDFFTDEEILSILAYIKDESAKKPEISTSLESQEITTSSSQESPNTILLQAIIIGSVAILVILLVTIIAMASVLSTRLKQRKDLSKEDKIYVNQIFSLKKVIRSSYFVNIVTFIFIILVANSVLDGLFAIGVQQGYAPEQPIKFSHKLHAGYYEIDCRYCHTGVEKSKNANIPSANICMNCHNSIRTTSPEIQKIYSAIENDRPIQWIRVHNLPESSLFQSCPTRKSRKYTM